MSQYNRHTCMDGVEASPDLAARRLIMAAILYYQLSVNIMSDHEYDALAVFVKDNFEAVSDRIRFCIGPEWAIEDGLCGWTSSGYQFKFTARLYNGALAWAEHLDVRDGDAPEFVMVDYDMEHDVEFDRIRS